MMIFDRLSRKRTAPTPERVLHDAAVAQSRFPIFYQEIGAADSVEGRFELLTLHVILLLDRLRDEPNIRQALFDTYVSDLDGALREMGVGDLSVPKRMKGLGAVFYGRAKAYDDAFNELPVEEKLLDLVRRTILPESPASQIHRLSGYVKSSRGVLAGQSTAAIISGDFRWGPP